MKDSAIYFLLDKELHQEAREKAGPVSLAVILRELLRRWVSDNIELDVSRLKRGK